MQFKEALIDYNKAIELNPNREAPYLGRGQIHLIQGNLNEALVDMNYALTLNPKLAAAYSDRGLVNLHLGNIQEAWKK